MSNYHIYVIELESRVAGNPLFRDENPNRDWSKPCLYVGQTAHAPELRLERHREERYSSPFVRRYGLRLRPDLYERHDPITSRDEAKDQELLLAVTLPAEGYGVAPTHLDCV